MKTKNKKYCKKATHPSTQPKPTLSLSLSSNEVKLSWVLGKDVRVCVCICVFVHLYKVIMRKKDFRI